MYTNYSNAISGNFTIMNAHKNIHSKYD